MWWSLADDLDGGFVDLESGEAFGKPDDDASTGDESSGDDDDDEEDEESDKGVY